MEERLDFSVSDYGRAVARIMQQDGLAVGAGFLIAPGYVLTCAHVVLQAKGVSANNFSDARYQDIPDDVIKLDFPLANVDSAPIEAKVVEWLPYSENRNDVAVLKIDKNIPVNIRSIPFSAIEFGLCQNYEFEVYGFPSQAGDWVRSYRPERAVDDGRMLLKKQDSSVFDVIESGFSGAPIWNSSEGSVVGMVATVQIENARKAYAIGWTKLERTLKKVSALSLYDVLKKALESSSEDDCNRLNSAIGSALQRCNPNGGDCPWQSQLIDLALDRPPVPGWEAESPLIYFAVMLAWMKDTPRCVCDQIQAWVDRHNVSFLEVLGRMTLDMKQKKVSACNTCDHVLVTIEPVDGPAQDDWRVSIWAIAAPSTQEVNRLPYAIVQDEVLALDTLPEFIQRQCRKRFGKKNVPLIHLFVPRSLFCCDIEMRSFGLLEERLGSVYPFVIRTNLTFHPIGQWYYDDWQDKWDRVQQNFDQPAHKVVEAVDCAALDGADKSRLLALMDALADRHAVILQGCESHEYLFELLAGEKDCALPIALWTRDPAFEAALPNLLNDDDILGALPERIWQERQARNDLQQALIGHHLSLVWEDPTVVPPDMQFAPEAC